MVEYRWFAVGILMIYVIVSEISVLPVIWPPSWIYGTHRCPMTSAVPLLKSVMGSRWNFLAMCSRTRDMPGGIFTPPPLPVNVTKKPLPGQGLKELTDGELRIFKSTRIAFQFLPCDALRCTVFVIVILSVRPSVCLSVCHTRALCPHGLTYDHDFFTVC